MKSSQNQGLVVGAGMVKEGGIQRLEKFPVQYFHIAVIRSQGGTVGRM